MIVSKCPLRVSLVGGSTDSQAFLNKYGVGKVISFPINLYTYITLNAAPQADSYRINYSATEDCENPNDIKNDIARELISYFNLPPLSISFDADISTSGSGLASSSSYMISGVAAAARFKKLRFSQEEICKLAHEIELSFNPLTGFQDTYGCGLPHAKLLTFSNNKNPEIKTVSLPEVNIFLHNTHQGRSSTDILKTIDTQKSYPLLSLTDEVYSYLQGDQNKLWKTLEKAWETKKSTSSRIINSELEVIENEILRDPGLKYHKLCGAGGGGYFLIVTSSDNLNLNCIKIGIDDLGVQTWLV